MDWDFTRLGVYPMEKRGLFGIFAHPLIHSNFPHLLANTLPLFFLSWCLFYFYRGIAPYIFFIIWVGCGAITYLIGKPGWHIGASGIIYGLAFFLFFTEKVYTFNCNFTIGDFSIWWAGMANDSLLHTCQHFMGRASEWSDNGNTLRICFRRLWATTPGTI